MPRVRLSKAGDGRGGSRKLSNLGAGELGMTTAMRLEVDALVHRPHRTVRRVRRVRLQETVALIVYCALFPTLPSTWPGSGFIRN
jgi:hypothetical protein